MRSEDPKTPVEKKPSVKPVAPPPANAEKQPAARVSTRKPADDDELEESESSAKRSRNPHKAPCVQCGAMTRIKTLEKKDGLCSRCYSPVVYVLIRMAVVLGIIGAIWGGVVYKIRSNRPVGETIADSDDNTDQNPKEKGLSPDQKIAALRRHLVDGISIAEVCKTFGIEEKDYQQWEQIFFQAGEQAFAPVAPKESSSVERRISLIEQKVLMLNKILGELRDSVTQLRKESGHYEGTSTQKFILDSVGSPPKK